MDQNKSYRLGWGSVATQMTEMGEKLVQAEERKEAMLPQGCRHCLGVGQDRLLKAAALLCLL